MKGIDKGALIDKFIFELPMLRTRLDMTQDEISEIIGVSRQTYSSIETRKRKMTWGHFMSLLFLFYYNPATRASVEAVGVFPDALKEILTADHRRNGE